MLIKLTLPQSLKGCYRRLSKPAQDISHQVKSRIKRCTPRHSYQSKKNPKPRRRVRRRGLRTRMHRCVSEKEPEKKNTHFRENVWIGNQDDAEVLKHVKITRVFHLDRKTIVLQPHIDNTPGATPQLAFYSAHEYDEYNILKDLDELCRIIRVEEYLGNQVLLYCSSCPSRDEFSRVRTLAIAYLMYIQRICFRCYGKFTPNAFEGIKKSHLEQLRVWNAVQDQSDSVIKAEIYSEWEDDKANGRAWRKPGFLD